MDVVISLLVEIRKCRKTTPKVICRGITSLGILALCHMCAEVTEGYPLEDYFTGTHGD